MAYGRGGVGNIQAVEQITARTSGDLEANSHDSQTRAARFIQETQGNREQQYAHTGRGGFANYFSPQELRSKGHFSDAHRSHILGDGTLAPAESADTQDAGNEPPSYSAAQRTAAPPRIGRGGAGNISFGVTEDEERAARKRIDQQEHQERLKAEIAKGVHESLTMPAPAKLAAAGHPV